MSDNETQSNSPVSSAVVILIAVALIAALAVGLVFTASVVADEDDDDEGSLVDSENRTDHDYGADYGIPGNDFNIFYSDTEVPDEEELEEGPDEDEDPEFDFEEIGDVRDTDAIADQAEDSADPEAWSEISDVNYVVTPSLIEIYGWTVSDYRANQIEYAGDPDYRGDQAAASPDEIEVDERHIEVSQDDFNWNVDESYILEEYEDQTQDGDVIKDAYVGIVGLNAASEPIFDYDKEQDYLAGSEGEVLTYVDFRFDTDELPDTEVQDPQTHYGSSFSYSTASSNNPYIDYSPGSSDYQTDKDYQTQEATTYHIERYDVERGVDMYGTWDYGQIDEAFGAGGDTHAYNNEIDTSVLFQVDGEVSADIYTYDQERERDRIYTSRYTHVSASTSTSGTASGWCSAGENSSTCSTTCSTTESSTADTTFTRSWSELGGDREIDIEETAEFEVSGRISGTCSGFVGYESSGVVSGTVSGTISGSQMVQVHYDYWDYWNPQDNSDTGGWEVVDEQYHTTDSVDLELDDTSARITDNNEIDVQQIAIEVEEDNRYHNVISLDYPGFYSEGVDYVDMPQHTFNDQYLWSMVMFGDGTYTKNELFSYSYTDTDEAIVATDDGEEVDDFPNQLGVYTYSEGSGLEMVSAGDDGHQNPAIAGWQGNYVDADEGETQDNAMFEPSQPIMHTEFVVTDAPEPASDLISIHGDQREITDDETHLIEYAEPAVSIQEAEEDGYFTITVTGEDNEPLDGRSLVASSPSTTTEATTGEDGSATVYLGEGTNHVEVMVEGDDIEDLLENPDTDVFYGSVTAERTIGFDGIVGYLYDIIVQAAFAIPLILLYLLWRDYELGT